MILYDLSVVKAHHEKSMKPHHEKKNLSNSSYSSETPIIPWISTHFPTIFPHLPLPFGNRVARSPDFAHAQWSASAAVNPADSIGGTGTFIMDTSILMKNMGKSWDAMGKIFGFRWI